MDKWDLQGKLSTTRSVSLRRFLPDGTSISESEDKRRTALANRPPPSRADRILLALKVLGAFVLLAGLPILFWTLVINGYLGIVGRAAEFGLMLYYYSYWAIGVILALVLAVSLAVRLFDWVRDGSPPPAPPTLSSPDPEHPELRRRVEGPKDVVIRDPRSPPPPTLSSPENFRGVSKALTPPPKPLQ